MLDEVVLRLALRLYSPYRVSLDPERVLLEEVRRQFPEGTTVQMRLVLRYVALVGREPVEILPGGEGRTFVDVRALAFTVDSGETLHGCIIGEQVNAYENGTKVRRVQITATEQIPVEMRVLLEKPLLDGSAPLSLQQGETITIVVRTPFYSVQTKQLGVLGSPLSQTSHPVNEFHIGTGTVSEETLKNLRATVERSLADIKELESNFKHLKKVRDALYGGGSGNTSLLKLLEPKGYNLKRIRMPHPWSGRVEVTPGLTLTEPPEAVLKGLVRLVERSVRELRDLAESYPEIPKGGRAGRIFQAQKTNSGLSVKK